MHNEMQTVFPLAAGEFMEMISYLFGRGFIRKMMSVEGSLKHHQGNLHWFRL